MAKQLIFIDDSGDPGFKPGRHSSKYFVVCCVIFNDEIDAEEAGIGIKVIKRDLHLAQDYELKFSRNSTAWRQDLLARVKKFQFKIRAVVVDKSKIDLSAKGAADNFYQFAIKEVLLRYSDMKNAKVYLDGSGGKNYRLRSAAYFRKELNKTGRKLSEFKLVDSKTDNLIQLADLIAGAICRKYEKGDGLYFKITKSKIDDLWEYE
jgi:hypothetical protein